MLHEGGFQGEWEQGQNCLDIYVDNIFILAKSAEDLSQASVRAIDIFEKGGFPLHEMISNNQKITDNFKHKGLCTKN